MERILFWIRCLHKLRKKNQYQTYRRWKRCDDDNDDERDREELIRAVEEDDDEHEGSESNNEKTSAWEGACTDDEFTSAYTFAREVGSTTSNMCRDAMLDTPLLRSHTTKMITEFAMKVLEKVPDADRVCVFEDINTEDAEMRYYATTACQLGLMGLDGNGVPKKALRRKQSLRQTSSGSLYSECFEKVPIIQTMRVDIVII